MKRERLTVAVAGDVIRDDGCVGPGFGLALRRVLGRRIRMVALCRQVRTRGTVEDAGFDELVIMPSPADGREAHREMLRQLDRRHGVDVLLVEGEAELDSLQCLTDELRSLNIRTAMPSRSTVERSTSWRLRSLAKELGILTPESITLTTSLGASRVIRKLGLPLVVRAGGREIDVAHSRMEVERTVNLLHTRGVGPIALQQFIPGEQYEVAIARDASGTSCVSVTMHKTLITRSDYAWAGRTVDDATITLFAETVTDGLMWHGPCRLSIVKDHQGRPFITGIRPCLPTWSYLAAADGANLPLVTLYLAMGKRPKRPYAAPSRLYYVRHPVELATELAAGPASLRGPDVSSAAYAYGRRSSNGTIGSPIVNLESSI